MPQTVTIDIKRPAPGTAVVALTGQCDTYTAPQVRAALIGLINNEARYRQVVDLAGLHGMGELQILAEIAEAGDA